MHIQMRSHQQQKDNSNNNNNKRFSPNMGKNVNLLKAFINIFMIFLLWKLCENGRQINEERWSGRKSEKKTKRFVNKLREN